MSILFFNLYSLLKITVMKFGKSVGSYSGMDLREKHSLCLGHLFYTIKKGQYTR